MQNIKKILLLNFILSLVFTSIFFVLTKKYFLEIDIKKYGLSSPARSIFLNMSSASLIKSISSKNNINESDIKLILKNSEKMRIFTSKKITNSELSLEGIFSEIIIHIEFQNKIIKTAIPTNLKVQNEYAAKKIFNNSIIIYEIKNILMNKKNLLFNSEEITKMSPSLLNLFLFLVFYNILVGLIIKNKKFIKKILL